MFARSRLPEVLAPAGNLQCLRAAIRAGADAVYFGVSRWNARARADNFSLSSLRDTMAEIHGGGAKGYLALNTLVFDSELPELESCIDLAAQASVDALIVQDLGVLRLAHAIAPAMRLHASTQMTCTDADSVRLAASLGASRVVLARELSCKDIAEVAREVDVELEVFVHGALCVAYSGQCLTSEAIGGRSANRGACAQACRLPYELVVDGVLRPTDDRAFLLSPEDLEAHDLVPSLYQAGVRSLKIEGRLKGPEYVAATTRLYRACVDRLRDEKHELDEGLIELSRQAFTRGSGHGFLDGVNHQRLVEGRSSDHRGPELGRVQSIEQRGGQTWVCLELEADVARGDGVLIQGGWGGEGEVGGRVWEIAIGGSHCPSARKGEVASLWLGPDRAVLGELVGRCVYRSSSPAREKQAFALSTQGTRPLDLRIRGREGELFSVEATLPNGDVVHVTGDASVEAAHDRPLTSELLMDKLGALGGTVFHTRTLDSDLPPGTTVSHAALKRARRALLQAIAIRGEVVHDSTGDALSRLCAEPVPRPTGLPSPGLFVLCRTLDQARGALDGGARGLILDFLDLTGLKQAIAALGARSYALGVAPPRIRKPGEQGIDSHLASLEIDYLLARSLSTLQFARQRGIACVADFSLNVTNALSARQVLSLDAAAFTPALDLHARQLVAFLDGELAPHAEVILHSHLPLFHMEHCVFARELSEGRDYRTCGRPCDRHTVSLRDRAAVDLPVLADVGCRNTVFHGRAQSAARELSGLVERGVSRFRIELLREDGRAAADIVRTYGDLLAGTIDASSCLRSLRAQPGYGIVSGSLRVVQ